MKNKEISQSRKMLLASLGAFLISIFAMISVIYAWIAFSEKASGDFIGTVGVFDIEYGFSQIINGELLDEDGFNLENVIPGKKFTFMLILGNDSTKNGFVSSSITDVHSQYYDGTGAVTDDYSLNPQDKVQYAYSYSVLEAYWVPSSDTLVGVDEIQVDSGTAQLPTPEQVDELGWEVWDASFHQYLVSFNTATYFSKTPAEGKTEMQNEYDLCVDVPLTPKGQEKSAFVIFFEITFNSTTQLPDFLIDEMYEAPDGKVYQNQRLLIDHILIVTKEE